MIYLNPYNLIILWILYVFYYLFIHHHTLKIVLTLQYVLIFGGLVCSHFSLFLEFKKILAFSLSI